MTTIIIIAANRKRHLIYKFANNNQTRLFIANYNLENRIVDIF